MPDQSLLVSLIFIVVVMAIWSFTRRKKKNGNPGLEATIGLLRDIDLNLKIVEMHLKNPDSLKKFSVSAWKFFKGKIDFLDINLITDINAAFSQAEDFNGKIKIARTSKNTAELHSLPMDELQRRLKQIRESLINWLRADYEEQQAKKRAKK